MSLQAGNFPDGRKGKKQTFEEVYDTCYERVFNFLYSKILQREDAEDITAETFIKAMRAYDNYDPAKSSVATWLCTIARNCLIDHVRRSHKDKIIPFDEAKDRGAADPELVKLDEDVEKRVFHIFKKLKPEESEILSMRYMMEMEYNDIGKMLAISPKAAAKRVERLLKKCREIDEGKM